MTANGEVFDDRADAYRKSGDMIAAIARRHYGLDIDDVTHERWRQLMGLMREIDTWADDGGVTSDEVLIGLAEFDLFRERYPELSPEALDIPTQEAMFLRTARILKLGKYAATETSARRYVALRIIEAREAVNLFSDTATEHVTKQPGFEEEFMPTLRALGEAATLWDSILDGRKDVRTGKQTVKPNIEYYARLAGEMLKRAKLGATALLHIEPNVHLGIKVGKRISNRLRNGVPEYSSLKIFTKD